MSAPTVSFKLDPRLAADTQLIGDLELSRLLLMDDARFPWLILVPRRPGMRELIDLPTDEQHVLLHEVGRCANALRDMEKPEKLNIAALGNIVAQLHVHVIARHLHDAAWPRPVWGVGERVGYDAGTLQSRLSSLRAALRIQVAR
jgi:diadenosine tetraphosphate (Ap4A) HIT family hydrolase